MALLYAVSMNNSKEQRGRKEKIKTTTSFFVDFTSMLKQGIIMQINGCAIVRTLSRTMVVAATKSSRA